MQNLKNKLKWIAYIVVAGLFVIGVPLFIDRFIFGNSIYSNITNESWAGFLGSYIGGICTLIGVYLTIESNNRALRKEREEVRVREEEQKRLSLRPYLDTRYTFFDENVEVGGNDRIINMEDENLKYIRFELSNTDRKNIQLNRNHKHSRLLYIKYIVRNIGAGSAVDMKISINGWDCPISISKDESIKLLFILHYKSDNSKEINIKHNYSDIEKRGDYSQTDIIRISKDDDWNFLLNIEKGEQQLLTKNES